MVTVNTVQARSGHVLALRFSDGTEGTADTSALLAKKAFQKLQDEAAFREAYVDHGAVEWPCGVGIATEALYALVHTLPRPTTLAEARANEAEAGLRAASDRGRDEPTEDAPRSWR
jgi:hypothetical protein